MQFSFVTTCRDRLADLRQTLPGNLARLHADEQLILLDYQCSQGTAGWAQELFHPVITVGRLCVYRLMTPAPRFRMSHAKNVAHLLGDGKVLVNLDADNYLDADYLSKLRSADWEGGLAMLYPHKGSGGFKGRTAVSRKVFIAAGGYDQHLDRGYGHEEIDLYLRLKAMGLPVKHVDIDPATAISTPDELKNAGQQQPDMPYHESSRLHREQSERNIKARRWVANQGHHWGEAELIDSNFRVTRISAH